MSSVAWLTGRWRWIAIIGLALIGGGLVGQAWRLDRESFGTLPEGEFEAHLQKYILEHPEVILESVRQYQVRQQAERANPDQSAIAAHSGELFQDSNAPVGGNPQGDVTLVEFFDYNCPYCRRSAPEMMAVEQSDVKLRIVYKEFPILGPNSEFAARAALAAHRQGKYREFHRALMGSTGVVDRDRVYQVAESVGVDLKQLKVDIEDPTIAAAIAHNLELAQALQITGTPGFVIGSYIFRGAADSAMLKSFVARARTNKAE